MRFRCGSTPRRLGLRSGRPGRSVLPTGLLADDGCRGLTNRRSSRGRTLDAGGGVNFGFIERLVNKQLVDDCVELATIRSEQSPRLRVTLVPNPPRLFV